MFNYYFILKPCNYARGKDIHEVSFDFDFTSYITGTEVHQTEKLRAFYIASFESAMGLKSNMTYSIFRNPSNSIYSIVYIFEKGTSFH